MVKLILSSILLLTQGCALTTPEGTKELLDDINRDRALQKNQHENFVGKPIFIKVRAYSRIEGNNIYGKQWIIMKIGHEKLDLNSLLNDMN